jgi:hypothetical protein
VPTDLDPLIVTDAGRGWHDWADNARQQCRFRSAI